ncbi:nephrin-like [Branchiostoma floridae]|uniref:receptor protein-tyrosine kinase n=1 Tax=Branchiostoma floridae TaxID=7739 RepID=A0A9J7HGK9_BRAFL|nr:nephrin-like [Branchiostoma floridae]
MKMNHFRFDNFSTVPPDPVLTISGYTTGVSAGQSLPLTCTSTQGKPPAHVTWWNGDVEQQQAVYSSTPDSSTYQGDATSVLTLAVQPANNQETYQCRVSQLETELERQNVQLNVRFMTGPPTLTGYSGPINTGSSLTLTCTTGSSNPPASISWTLVGGSASSATFPSDTEGQYGGTITSEQTILPNQRPQDNGSQIKCTATKSELGQSMDSSTVTINVRFYLGGIGITGHTNSVTSGSSLTLTCTSGSSNPPANISWTRVGGAAPTGTDQPQTDGQHGGKITSQQISLTNLQAQDNGAQFKCTVTNSAVSQREEKTVTIDVQYAPTNVQVSCNPSDLSDLREGRRLECTCTADSNPAAQYSWIKDSTAGPLPTGVVLDTTVGTLTFSTLDRTHSGVYSCTANSGISPEATSGGVTLDIKYAPIEPTIVSNATTVEEGDSVQLTCQTTSNPPALYNWTKQSGDLPGDAKEETIGQTSVLVIPGLTKDDSGTYICTASNVVLPGGTAEDYNLTVLYLHQPIVRSNEVSIVDGTLQQAAVGENTNVSITCTADANPTAEIKWTGPQEEVTNEGQLQFNHVERTHAGNHTCKASNSIKGEPRSKEVTLEITVNYPASITCITPPVAVDEYDDVNMTCTADSNPAPDNFSWAYMDGTTLTGTTSVNRFSLTTSITAITYQQAGTYTCTAGNGIGTADSEGTNVTVEYAPKFYPPPDPYPAAIGADVSMQCSAFAVPNSIAFTWSTNGTTLTNSSRLNIQSSRETSVLTIIGVEQVDYGTYNCTAANIKGSSSTTRTLQPLGPPGTPSGLIVLSKNTQFVVRIAWTADFNGGLDTAHIVQLREVGADQWEDVGSRQQTASEQRRTFNITLDLKAQQAGDYQIRINARNTQGEAWSESVDLKLEASQHLSGRMTTNENWVEALKDSESTEFRQKKALWERNLDKVFSSLIGYEGATITQFSQGSVVGDFEAVVAESETQAAIEAFETQVNTGSVGDLTVVKESSQISVTRPPVDGDSTATIIIIAAVVCGVVFLAIIGVGVFVFRRWKSANKKPGQNHQNNIELDRVRDDTDGGYQSLKIPNRRTSDHTYQGLMARSGNETSPDATYEDVKTQSEFPRNQLDIKEELGQGEFGSVYKAEAWKISGNTGVTTVAVKELKGMTGPASSTAFFKELSVLKLLGTHPNVVSFLGCCTGADPFYLLLEYVSGGSLQSNLRTSRTQQTYGNLHGGSKSLSSRDLTKFAWDVAKGMSFLSAKKVN